MRLDPTVVFLLLMVIGIVAGLIFDRLAGPGWLTRQIAGARRSMITSSLVGIAGSFVGFHVAGLIALGAAGGYVPLIAAAIGAAVVLWLWRIMR